MRGGADAAAEPELADAEAEWWSFHSYSPETLRRIAQSNRGWALGCEERLQAIHTPSLLLLGDPDPDRAGPLPSYVSLEEAAHYRTLVGSCVTIRSWEGVGHGMHMDQPERLIEEAREVLL